MCGMRLYHGTIFLNRKTLNIRFISCEFKKYSPSTIMDGASSTPTPLESMRQASIKYNQRNKDRVNQKKREKYADRKRLEYLQAHCTLEGFVSPMNRKRSNAPSEPCVDSLDLKEITKEFMITVEKCCNLRTILFRERKTLAIARQCSHELDQPGAKYMFLNIQTMQEELTKLHTELQRIEDLYYFT
jgi:hypothetical protein